MARIQITFAGVASANRVLRKAVGELARLEDAYASLSGGVDPEIQSRRQIAERLRACRRSAETIRQAVGGILNVTEAGLLEYRITEAGFRRAAPADDETFEMR